MDNHKGKSRMEKLALVIGIVGGIMTILGFSVRELVSEYLLGQNKAIVLNVEAHKENGVIEDIIKTAASDMIRERNYIVRMVGQVAAGEKTGTLESFADVYLTEDQS